MEYPEGLLPAIEKFLEGAREKASTRSNEIETVELTSESGPRYIRVIAQRRHNKSYQVVTRAAYCFIDKSNGDVLKAAGWKGPAKGRRSSIFDADHGMSGLTPYGAIYHYR